MNRFFFFFGKYSFASIDKVVIHSYTSNALSFLSKASSSSKCIWKERGGALWVSHPSSCVSSAKHFVEILKHGICYSTYQSLMFLVGTEATLTISRIPPTFILCVVKDSLKNSQFMSFNKLFCYDKCVNLDPCCGFFHLKSITQVSKEPEHLFPQGLSEKEYICPAVVCIKVFLIH